jgi:DNA-3-methyladenine glycosylase II
MKHVKIKSHFQSVDPIISSAWGKMPPRILKPVSNDPLIYFQKLCDDIVSQQLAGSAATSIFNRFINLMPTKKFTPRHVLKLKDQALRDVGLSWAKASYIKNLAEKVNNQEVRLEKLSKLDDEAVIAELVKVKGIGPWTAEMFLMFSLGREDVFSHGDLGLRNGLVKLYQLRKPPTIERANRIVNRWSPYKSYGSLALWHSLDNR